MSLLTMLYSCFTVFRTQYIYCDFCRILSFCMFGMLSLIYVPWYEWCINMMQYSFQFPLIFIFEMNCEWFSKATCFFSCFTIQFLIRCAIVILKSFLFDFIYFFLWLLPVACCEFKEIKMKFIKDFVCINLIHMLSIFINLEERIFFLKRYDYI